MIAEGEVYDEGYEEDFINWLEGVADAKQALSDKYPHLDMFQINEVNVYRNQIIRSIGDQFGFEQTLINSVDNFVQDNYECN